jgi:hypothetical protein
MTSRLNIFVYFQNNLQSFKRWVYRKGVDTLVTRFVALPFVTAFSPKVCLLILGTSYVAVNTITTQQVSDYTSPVIECLASYTLVYRNLDLICEYALPVTKTIVSNSLPVAKAVVANAVPVLKTVAQTAFPLTKGLVEDAINN